MKAEKDELRLLIRGMGAAEKRYFRIFAGNSAGRKHGNYLQLFDALLEEAEDGIDVREKLADAPFLQHLSPTRSRLMNLLLDSLNSKRAANSLDGRLRSALGAIAVLLERGLLRTTRKKIARARELALQGERYHVLLQLLDVEVQCYSHELDDAADDFFQRIHHEQQRLLEALQRLSRMRTLHESVRALNHRDMYQRLGKSTVMTRMEHLLADPLLQADPPEDSLLTLSYHQNIHGIHLLRSGQVAQAHALYAQLMDRWKAQPVLRNAEFAFYLGLVNNYLTSTLYAVLDPREILNIVADLRQIRGLSPMDQMKLERITHSHSLNYHINYGNFPEGEAYVRRFEIWLKKHARHLQAQRLQLFQYNLASFYFVNGRFSDANHHVQKILNFSARTGRQDIRNFVPLMRLVIQHELGHESLGEYALRATYRAFHKGQLLYDYEDAIIQYFRKIQEITHDREAQETATQALKTALEEISTRKGENPFGLPLINLWIESRLRRMPIRKWFEATKAAQRTG
ncbi:MAG: hypothetical protein AAF570_06810 [Bacteroidota bacterium]